MAVESCRIYGFTTIVRGEELVTCNLNDEYHFRAFFRNGIHTLNNSPPKRAEDNRAEE